MSLSEEARRLVAAREDEGDIDALKRDERFLAYARCKIRERVLVAAAEGRRSISIDTSTYGDGEHLFVQWVPQDEAVVAWALAEGLDVTPRAEHVETSYCKWRMVISW